MGNDVRRNVSKENTLRNAGGEVNGRPRNRMNDALAKFIFANEQHKDSTLALINSVFEFEGTKEIVDLEFKDRELDYSPVTPVSSLDASVKIVVSAGASSFTAAITAMATSAMIRPYSTMPCPLSSLKKFIMFFSS